jgi:hypothetical protein
MEQRKDAQRRSKPHYLGAVTQTPANRLSATEQGVVSANPDQCHKLRGDNQPEWSIVIADHPARPSRRALQENEFRRDEIGDDGVFTLPRTREQE